MLLKHLMLMVKELELKNENMPKVTQIRVTVLHLKLGLWVKA